ncbi:hypothetical protein JK635_07615 [Neobacillus sp. YIM B02564]|uniref:Uncharacterized protein n=1 Tax=Neobacillus paridis TaxID=2803862 RepID=A0ABS1TPC0_9BACI|nr:hypothetical protein [Neobacillus paridis]MBL4952076.1 hypothetical protein [Neobacillus paridis]
MENHKAAILLADLLFAYINKDEDFPHDFEVKAVENAVDFLEKHYTENKYNLKLFKDTINRIRSKSG